MLLDMIMSIKQQFNELINERIQTNRDQKSSLLLQWHDQSQKCQIKVVKNWQKPLQRD